MNKIFAQCKINPNFDKILMANLYLSSFTSLCHVIPFESQQFISLLCDIVQLHMLYSVILPSDKRKTGKEKVVAYLEVLFEHLLLDRYFWYGIQFRAEIQT
jgi:hypothetical protein